MNSLMPISEETLRTIAKIIGSFGAAAQALAKAEEHRAAGQRAEFFTQGTMIIVRASPSAGLDAKGD